MNIARYEVIDGVYCYPNPVGHAECVRVLLDAGAPLLLCYPGPGGYDWPRGDTPGVARSREEIASAIFFKENYRLQVEAAIKKYNTPPKWACSRWR